MKLLGKSIPDEEHRRQIMHNTHQQGHYGHRAMVESIYKEQIIGGRA